MKKLIFLSVFFYCGCQAQIRPLNQRLDTTILTHYLFSFNSTPKKYDINAPTETMKRYLNIFKQSLNYSHNPLPYTDQNNLSLLQTSSKTRASYLNSLNFGTRKDGSNNLSGTRFNKSYSEYSKRYDYLYRKD